MYDCVCVCTLMFDVHVLVREYLEGISFFLPELIIYLMCMCWLVNALKELVFFYHRVDNMYLCVFALTAEVWILHAPNFMYLKTSSLIGETFLRVVD